MCKEIEFLSFTFLSGRHLGDLDHLKKLYNVVYLSKIIKYAQMDILTSEYPLVNVTQLSILISLSAENAFPIGIINNTYD